MSSFSRSRRSARDRLRSPGSVWTASLRSVRARSCFGSSRGAGRARQQRALRLIGFAFIALAIYVAVQSTVVLIVGHHPHHSPVGIVWTALTAAVMFTLAAGKARTGAALDNPVLRTEGRVTLIDGLLALSVLIGLTLNATAGAWWADPVAGFVIVFYGIKEAVSIFRSDTA